MRMRLERRPVLPPAALLPLALVLALAAAFGSGCAATKGLRKTERENEGIGAERRAAEARVAEMTKAGTPALQGTTSSVPSLAPGEGEPLLQAPAPPPATAPAGDKFDDKNPAHLLARCRDRSARHEWFDAVGDCRRAAELDPTSVEPQVELMRLLVSLQAYSDAEEAATKVLAAKPNDPVALYYLAWSYRGRDRFPEAIAALQKALAADPKRLEFVQALGMTYCLADNYGKGIATFERALAMAPSDARTKASLESAKAMLVEKLAPYRRMVKENPSSHDAQAALGFMCQKYGLLEQALKAYDTALSRMPGPLPEQDADVRQLAAQIHYNRGVVHRELGRPERSEAELWQSIQLDAALAPQAWYIAGLARYDSGKYDGAIEALRKSIDLAPDVAENRAALADAYEKAGKLDLAREQRNAVLAIRARETEAKAAARAEEKEQEAAQ
jgi:tetratricopeptide (TPR) repeat protein